MALFNISVLLTIWHQSRFTKMMNAKLSSSENQTCSSSLKTAEENESLIKNSDDENTDIEEVYTFENMRKEIFIKREMKLDFQRQETQQKDDKEELMAEIKELKTQIAKLFEIVNSSIQ
jgi:anti-sigma-K factor RskA